MNLSVPVIFLFLTLISEASSFETAAAPSISSGFVIVTVPLSLTVNLISVSPRPTNPVAGESSLSVYSPGARLNSFAS